MTTPSNVLPHNPLTGQGLMEEVKKLKGDKGWLEFDLECLLAKYPDSTVLHLALKELLDKKAKAQTTSGEVMLAALTGEATPPAPGKEVVAPTLVAKEKPLSKKAAKKAAAAKKVEAKKVADAARAEATKVFKDPVPSVLTAGERHEQQVLTEEGF